MELEEAWERCEYATSAGLSHFGRFNCGPASTISSLRGASLASLSTDAPLDHSATVPLIFAGERGSATVAQAQLFVPPIPLFIEQESALRGKGSALHSRRREGDYLFGSFAGDDPLQMRGPALERLAFLG